jgi:hypothetical protein
MSANKIAETSTSTGTGNITLAGAWSVPSSFITGNRTFNSFYGLNHRFPYMVQDLLGNWEKGYGFLSAANILVRETVIDNSLSNTSLINFPSGEKLIMIPTDAGSLWPNTLDAASAIFTAGQAGLTSTGMDFAANRVILSPFNSLRPIAVTAFVFEVTSAAASSNLKPVIYTRRSAANATYDLVAVGTAVDASTTGIKTAAISANIGQGMYFVGAVANGVPHLRASNSPILHCGYNNQPGGGEAGVIFFSGTGFYDSPPQTRTGGGTDARSQCLRIGLQGRLL